MLGADGVVRCVHGIFSGIAVVLQWSFARTSDIGLPLGFGCGANCTNVKRRKSDKRCCNL